jgi:hypothetical protein
MARRAPSSLPMLTNAKPRERPVSRSRISFTSVTVSIALNASWTSFSVVWNAKLPT